MARRGGKAPWHENCPSPSGTPDVVTVYAFRGTPSTKKPICWMCMACFAVWEKDVDPYAKGFAWGDYGRTRLRDELVRYEYPPDWSRYQVWAALDDQAEARQRASLASEIRRLMPQWHEFLTHYYTFQDYLQHHAEFAEFLEKINQWRWYERATDAEVKLVEAIQGDLQKGPMPGGRRGHFWGLQTDRPRYNYSLAKVKARRSTRLSPATTILLRQKVEEAVASARREEATRVVPILEPPPSTTIPAIDFLPKKKRRRRRRHKNKQPQNV